jgi:hypothetical protein
MNKFEIRIEKQDWLTSAYADQDLCSHGYIFLKVQDTVITSLDMQEEWGISESALALLRTLKYNHPASHGDPVSECLIFHGCGTLLMSGCPILIDWRVTHSENNVILSDFVKYPTPNENDAVRYTHLYVEMPIGAYRDQIYAFAMEAKRLFEESPEKQIDDDFDLQMYGEFWNEYNQLLKYAETL